MPVYRGVSGECRSRALLLNPLINRPGLQAEFQAALALAALLMQIVGDLKTLRTLAEHLLSFDPVTFLAYLDNLRITDSVNTIWMFHAAANSVFDQV